MNETQETTTEEIALFAINAAAMNAQYGDAQFPIPTLSERQNLQPGGHAKVGISWPTDKNGCSGERFWVIILERRNGRYLAIIDNDLLSDKLAVTRGGLIQFGPEHVLDVDPSKIVASPALIMIGDVVDRCNK